MMMMMNMNVQHLAIRPVGNVALPPRVERVWREADKSPPFSSEVKNSWS
jgi:hypothetical protein